MEEQIYSPGMQEILSVNMFSGFSMTYAGKKDVIFQEADNIVNLFSFCFCCSFMSDQGISKKD